MARGDLAKRITEQATDKRSPAYRWMRLNYADLSKAVPVRGSWAVIRTAAIEAGVTVTKGGKEVEPSVPALRSAWHRVEADMGARSQKRRKAKAPVESTPAPVQQPVSATALGPPQALPADDHDDPPPDFPFVKERR